MAKEDRRKLRSWRARLCLLAVALVVVTIISAGVLLTQCLPSSEAAAVHDDAAAAAAGVAPMIIFPPRRRYCNTTINGECKGEEVDKEENTVGVVMSAEEEFQLDSEIHRRILAAGGKPLSYPPVFDPNHPAACSGSSGLSCTQKVNGKQSPCIYRILDKECHH